jgi:hypothetical protein
MPEIGCCLVVRLYARAGLSLMFGSFLAISLRMTNVVDDHYWPPRPHVVYL